MSRTRRPAPPPRRRPVAGTRGRRPSSPADPPAAPAETVRDKASRDEATRDRATRDNLSRPRPAPHPKTPSARPGPTPAPRRIPAREGLSTLTRAWLLTVLAVVAVLLCVVTGALGWGAWQASRTAAASEDALAAARSHAQEILSYDYRNIDADIARAKQDITGSFRSEYTLTTRTVVKPTAVQYHAVVKATVKAASVVSATPTKVVVLLFVDQTTTSTRVTGPKVDQSRVRMTLVKTRGRWLVSKVDAL